MVAKNEDLMMVDGSDESNSANTASGNSVSTNANVQLVEQMETPNTETTNSSAKMDAAEGVTPKSTGRPLKVRGRKKVVRTKVAKSVPHGVGAMRKAGRTVKPKSAKLKPRHAVDAKREAGEHPSYKEMIDEAIFNSGSRKGVSRIAIKNYIVEKYPVGGNKTTNANIRKAIHDLVAKNELLLVDNDGKRSDRYRLAPEIRQKMRKTKSDSEATPKQKAALKSEPAKRKSTGTPKKRKSTPSKETPAKKAKKSGDEVKHKTKSTTKKPVAQKAKKDTQATKIGAKRGARLMRPSV